MKGLFSVVFLLFAVAFSTVVYGQPDQKQLTYESFIEIVKAHHPVAFQADQRIMMAKGQMKTAQGGFDPNLTGSFNQKEYAQKRYYQLIDAGLKVPTYIGVDLNAGYTQSMGDYVSAMDYTPANGLVYAGVEVPLGKGLLFDKRRAALKKAALAISLSELEQKQMLNDLILDASFAYWTWFEKYHQTEAAAELLNQAKIRLENTKKSAQLGDKPDIDTLEAHIQMVNFRTMYLDFSTELLNARENLEVFLWADGLMPLEVDTATQPMGQQQLVYNTSYVLDQEDNDSIWTSHPDFLTYQNKIASKEFELRLRKENLKPKLNLKYNFLHEPLGNEWIGFNPNDYKFGVDFEIPIFLRAARGQVSETRAEILTYESARTLKQAELQAKFDISVNNLRNAILQLSLLEENVLNYRKLVAAENKLYAIGESSLMMVNYREMALLEAELKWIEKMSKSKTAEVKILYSLGTLGSNP